MACCKVGRVWRQSSLRDLVSEGSSDVHGLVTRAGGSWHMLLL